MALYVHEESPYYIGGICTVTPTARVTTTL